MGFNWTSKSKLYKYQEEGVAMALSSPYCIIADDMGLGKTWQAIKVATERKVPTLVVVPTCLNYNWQNEFRNLTDCVVYSFDKKHKEIEGVDVVLVNYSQLKDAEHLFKWASLVILEEAHYLKTPTSQRTQTAFSYLHKYRPTYVVALSGTPIKNRVPEFYTLLRVLALDPTNYRKITTKYPSYFTFCHHFSNVRESTIGYRTITTFYGHKNTDELKTYLEGRYIRRMKADVLELPKHLKKYVATKYVEDPGLQEAWEFFKDSAAVGVKDVVAKKNTAIAKAKFTASYAIEVSQTCEGPVIIFSDHREPVRIIGLELSNKRTAMVTGETPAKQRADIVQQFQNGQLDFLVATIGSLEMGHTLTKSNQMIFNDVSWVPGTNQQAEARIDRIGQTVGGVYHYITGGAMDEYITKALKSKENTLKEVLSVSV